MSTLRTHILAISGGSCSGKTTLAQALVKRFGADQCCHIAQDNYYKSPVPSGNYDLPEALQFDLLARHLTALKQGQPIEIPQYDFSQHIRLAATTLCRPTPLIFVDGTLLLHAAELWPCFDARVFLECTNATRLERRIHRDVANRGRTVESVLHQFNTQVAPAHVRFVQPSRSKADWVYDQTALSCLDACTALVNFCENALQHTDSDNSR